MGIKLAESSLLAFKLGTFATPSPALVLVIVVNISIFSLVVVSVKKFSPPRITARGFGFARETPFAKIKKSELKFPRTEIPPSGFLAVNGFSPPVIVTKTSESSRKTPVFGRDKVDILVSKIGVG